MPSTDPSQVIFVPILRLFYHNKNLPLQMPFEAFGFPLVRGQI